MKCHCCTDNTEPSWKLNLYDFSQFHSVKNILPTVDKRDITKTYNSTIWKLPIFE